MVLLALTNQGANMYYVYIYKDPRPTKNQQVVYVGKGTGDRAWYHWKVKASHNKGFGAFLALLRREKREPIIEIIKDNLDEAEAFYEEMMMIEVYGRRDLGTGTLFNLTDGGEGTSGAIRTEEWRNKVKEVNSTPEKIALYSEGQKRRWANPTFREQTIAAIRKALQDPEVIARREAGKAAFIHTEAFRQTMSDATSKLWQDPDYVKKVTEAQNLKLVNRHGPTPPYAIKGLMLLSVQGTLSNPSKRLVTSQKPCGLILITMPRRQPITKRLLIVKK
jgi:hypothetical protein